MVDGLRLPSATDPQMEAYKDWLHLEVLDHPSGIVGLINLSLNGPPGDPRSRAGGAALFDVPGVGWVGNVEIRSMFEAGVGSASVALESIALAVDHHAGTVSASVRLPSDGLVLSLVATAQSPALDVEDRMPLGPGWFAWYVVPRLRVSGAGRLGDRAVDFAHASAYHDHSWGRWHWGDDFGWDWAVLHAPPPGPAFVLARTTDRHHRHQDSPVLLAELGRERRIFRGACVDYAFSGQLGVLPRRVPGAMAALHQDRREPRLPSRALVRAHDGFDHVELEFTGRAAVQLIAPDPIRRGYSFLHEMPGTFSGAWKIGGTTGSGSGLALFERVD